MRPSSCLGPQLPGSAFSCRSRQMVARLRKKRLFCSTTKKKKKKSNYAGGKKKKPQKNPTLFSPRRPAAWRGWLALPGSAGPALMEWAACLHPLPGGRGETGEPPNTV